MSSAGKIAQDNHAMITRLLKKVTMLGPISMVSNAPEGHDIDSISIHSCLPAHACHPLNDLLWVMHVVQDGKVYNTSGVQIVPTVCENEAPRLSMKLVGDNLTDQGLYAFYASLLLPAINEALGEFYDKNNTVFMELSQQWENAAIEFAAQQAMPKGELYDGDNVFFFRRGSHDPVLDDMYAPDVAWMLRSENGRLRMLGKIEGEIPTLVLPMFNGDDGSWRLVSPKSANEFFENQSLIPITGTTHYVASWFDKMYSQPIGAQLVTAICPVTNS